MTKEQNARESLILTLLMGYHSFQARVSDGVLNTYLEAVAGFRLKAVAHATKRFAAGDVEGHNNAFPPSAAQLAHQSRLFDDVLRSIEDEPAPALVVYPIGEAPPAGTAALGPISVDFGRGVIDMRDLTPAEKDRVFELKGLPPADGALPLVPKLRRL